MKRNQRNVGQVNMDELVLEIAALRRENMKMRADLRILRESTKFLFKKLDEKSSRKSAVEVREHDIPNLLKGKTPLQKAPSKSILH